MNWLHNLPVSEVIEWRRHLHQHPEVSFEEFETANFIAATIAQFPHLEITRPTPNSVVAILKGAHPGKTIALRADIDALPVTEQADVEFRSLKPGVMHACGHDGHTAMLMGAAKVLSGLRDDIAGEIRIVFQHAEEVPPGGAKDLVAAGVFDGVDNVFGLHLMPRLPVGTIGISDGFISASQDIFELTIHGIGSHGSTPELSVDPITVGAQVISNLNSIVSRNVGALENAVLSFGQFTSGDVFNVIPAKATIKGTVRTVSPEVRALMKKRIFCIVEQITNAYEATYEMNWLDGYSSVFNEDQATELVREAARELLGEASVQFFPRIMGSEDFSAYTNICKGSFFWLGGGTAEQGCGHMIHNPKYKICEDAFEVGMKMHVQIAMKCVGKK